jgi:hypothetical protein
MLSADVGINLALTGVGNRRLHRLWPGAAGSMDCLGAVSVTVAMPSSLGQNRRKE